MSFEGLNGSEIAHTLKEIGGSMARGISAEFESGRAVGYASGYAAGYAAGAAAGFWVGLLVGLGVAVLVIGGVVLYQRYVNGQKLAWVPA